MNIDFLNVQTISSIQGGNLLANLKITPPKLANDAKRNNVAIICVLDISGSMDTEATQGQSTESDGFNRLDLVKHSVNTIIHALDENDVLGVVTFSDKSRVDFPIGKMNQNGKKKALKMIGDMKTEGSTNLWDGIKSGLQLARSNQCTDRNTFVVVLTDGQPNQHPPGGQVKAMNDYLHQHPLQCNLSVFGYGYSLNTKLLTEITQIGGGCYGYIPDCSMVGTIFVNFLSHSLACFTSLITVEVKTKNGQFISLNGHNRKKIVLGSAQYDFTRNCLVNFKNIKEAQEACQIIVRYGKNLRKDVTITLSGVKIGEEKNIQIQKLRFKYLNFLSTAIQKATLDKLQQAKKQQVQLVEQMKQGNKTFQSEYLESLIRDMQSKVDTEGQVGKALQSKQWWNKWGKHYLPALKIAHTNQMCTNFKDPGLQAYGSDEFRKIEAQIDTIFIKLPPPKPSIKKYDPQGNVHQVNNMANYYNRYGGCIHGQCNAELMSGQIKKVKDLKKGDMIKTHIGYSKIKCVLETKVQKQIEMVKFNDGLIITNYHPILDNGQWKFPIDLKVPQKMFIDKYFNFVVEEGHSILINNVYCVTLGHNMRDNYVIQHEYLGTHKIIDDLSKINGWDSGNISIGDNIFKRDPISNKIIGVY